MSLRIQMHFPNTHRGRNCRVGWCQWRKLPGECLVPGSAMIDACAPCVIAALVAAPCVTAALPATARVAALVRRLCPMPHARLLSRPHASWPRSSRPVVSWPRSSRPLVSRPRTSRPSTSLQPAPNNALLAATLYSPSGAHCLWHASCCSPRRTGRVHRGAHVAGACRCPCLGR
jgi:hypothetical protein